MSELDVSTLVYTREKLRAALDAEATWQRDDNGEIIESNLVVDFGIYTVLVDAAREYLSQLGRLYYHGIVMLK